MADNTDVYAFVSPDRPDTVTLIANFIPFEGPAGGPASGIADGTSNTNAPYLTSFPYLGTPAGGFQSLPGTPRV